MQNCPIGHYSSSLDFLEAGKKLRDPDKLKILATIYQSKGYGDEAYETLKDAWSVISESPEKSATERHNFQLMILESAKKNGYEEDLRPMIKSMILDNPDNVVLVDKYLGEDL